MNYYSCSLVLLAALALQPMAFVVLTRTKRGARGGGVAKFWAARRTSDDFDDDEPRPTIQHRRSFLSTVAAAGGAVFSALMPSSSALAAAAAKDLKEDYRQGTAALAEMDDQAPVPREAYKKLDSGVIYADLRTGNGEAVGTGRRVNLQVRTFRLLCLVVINSPFLGGFTNIIPTTFAVGAAKVQWVFCRQFCSK